MARAGHWRARLQTLEAIVLLAHARWLVAHVPMARWRKRMGLQVPGQIGDPALRLEGNLPARRLARAVQRGAARLPGETLCLPQAMALQWMLGRRGLGGILVIGVGSAPRRGKLDDLHAWVVRHGEVLLGASAESHHPIYAARF